MTEISPAMNALYHGGTEKGEQLLSDEPTVFEAAAFGRVDDLRRIAAADPEAAQSRAPDDFTALRRELSQQTKADALAANGALLHSLSQLLTNLIGASLTGRLLQSVWEKHGHTVQDTSS